MLDKLTGKILKKKKQSLPPISRESESDIQKQPEEDKPTLNITKVVEESKENAE